MNTIHRLYRFVGVARISEGTALGLIAVAAFGMTLPLTRIAVPFFGPWGVSALRAAVGGLAALAILLAERAPFPSALERRELAVVALGTVFGFPVFSALSMNRAPASHGAVVMAIVPLLTAIVGSRLSYERLPARFWLASVFGSASVAVFALGGARVGLATADAWLLCAAIAAAVGYAYGGRLARTLGGARVICWALVFSLPISLPAAVLSTRHLVAPPTVAACVSMLYLALVSQLGGFFLWNRALAVGGIARTSQTQLLQPFFTIGAAALFAGESVHGDLIVFAAVVALSVAVGRSRSPLLSAQPLAVQRKNES